MEELLESGEWSLTDLKHRFHCSYPEVIEDIEHIKRTIKQTKRMIMIPAKCGLCDFVFKERSKVKPPTKCPECKREKIEEPKFVIKIGKK